MQEMNVLFPFFVLFTAALHHFSWVRMSCNQYSTTWHYLSLYESNYVFSYPSGLIMLEQKTMVLHLLILCHLIVKMKCSYL